MANMLARLGIRLGALRQHPPRPLVVDGGPFPVPSGRSTIGIVTPVFNQRAFVARTIRSVLDQAYPALRYAVKDGGSTDGTWQEVQQFQSNLADSVHAPDRGQADAINVGFRRLGPVDLMAWINGDDLLLPGTLARVADYFERHPEVDVVYGHRVLIDEDDCEIGRWILPAHDDRILSWVDYVPQETLFWRRSIWERSGGRIDDSFQFALDWDLLLRFRDAGARIVSLPWFLAAFRIHSSQKTSAQMSSTGLSEMRRIWRREFGHEPTWLRVRMNVLPFLLRHLSRDLRYRWLGRS